MAQSDDPWSFNSNNTNNWVSYPSNTTAFRYWDYFPSSAAGESHSGSMPQATISSTANYSISGSPSCDVSVTRDIWFKVPPNSSGAGTVTLKIALINYTTSDPIPARFRVYKTSSNCVSGSCALTFVQEYCNSNLDTEGSCTVGVGGMDTRTINIAVASNENLYIQMWADDNDGDMSGSLYAYFNASSSTSPSNDACTSPTIINSSTAMTWSGSNFGASGSGDITPPGTCSWNVSDQTVYYMFQASASSATISFQNVACSFSGGCAGAPSSDLQVAIYGPYSSSTASSCSVAGKYITCANSTGSFSINLSSLIVNSRYTIAIDSRSGAMCSWSGISVNNVVPLSINYENKGLICVDGQQFLDAVIYSSKDNKSIVLEYSFDGDQFIFGEEYVGFENSMELKYRRFLLPSFGREYYAKLYEVNENLDKTLIDEFFVQKQCLSNELVFVYPNPSNDFLCISSDRFDFKNSKLSIFNSIGQEIEAPFHLTMANGKSDVVKIITSNLINGIYTIMLSDINGNHCNQKIVINH